MEMAPVGAESHGDSDPLLKETTGSSGSSSCEIENEPDVETASLPCCRICLECDGQDGMWCFCYLIYVFRFPLRFYEVFVLEGF